MTQFANYILQILPLKPDENTFKTTEFEERTKIRFSSWLMKRMSLILDEMMPSYYDKMHFNCFQSEWWHDFKVYFKYKQKKLEIKIHVRGSELFTSKNQDIFGRFFVKSNLSKFWRYNLPLVILWNLCQTRVRSWSILIKQPINLRRPT